MGCIGTALARAWMHNNTTGEHSLEEVDVPGMSMQHAADVAADAELSPCLAAQLSDPAAARP